MTRRHKQAVCSGPNGTTIYRARVVPFDAPGPNGEWSRVAVDVSADGGASWQELPMRLPWWELRHRLVGAWPPETFDRLFFDDGILTLEYRDQWIPYERPILPFKLDVESLWRARYVAPRREWRLTRIRHLDFDGADQPS